MSTVVKDEEDTQIPVPELLGVLLDLEGSDLHLTAGVPPVDVGPDPMGRLDDLNAEHRPPR